jgi:predicted O-methyltransferase YrrM
MPQAEREITRLSLMSNVASKSVANALRKTLANSLTPDEKVWVNRIEALRRELNSSGTEISRVFHGEGSSSRNGIDKETHHGTIVTSTVKNESRKLSSPYLWSLLSFNLIRELKPSVCLELGTAFGISASYQAAALKLNQRGKIITLEGSESFALLAKHNFQTLGFDNAHVVIGRFQDTLYTVLKEHGPIDYAYIDGHHEEKATLDYFQQICCFLSARAVLVFDDISWSSGMKKAWSVIASDKLVKISLDLLRQGICIIDSDIDRKENIIIPIV